MNKFLIITSIFEPSEAVKKFSNLLKDWKIVIVADTKTPKRWNLKSNNIIFLSLEEQKKLPFKIVKHLPFNNYARKNIGYLYAISKGADIIAETDDDNIPYNFWEKELIKQLSCNKFDILCTKKNDFFINIYGLFTRKKVWPRGFPIQYVNKSLRPFLKKEEEAKIAVYQFLADLDPDVDAIYRLTVGKEIIFNKKNGFVLNKGLFSPFNSQNTVFIKIFFPLLYLPVNVSIRATDIYRSYIVQRIVWEFNYLIFFGKATVYQKRNIHNYLRDFELEIPVYLNVEKIARILSNLKFKEKDIYKMIKEVYNVLIEEDIIPKKELIILNAWIDDCKGLNM